jgi:hypothetical protein
MMNTVIFSNTVNPANRATCMATVISANVQCKDPRGIHMREQGSNADLVFKRSEFVAMNKPIEGADLVWFVVVVYTPTAEHALLVMCYGRPTEKEFLSLLFDRLYTSVLKALIQVRVFGVHIESTRAHRRLGWLEPRNGQFFFDVSDKRDADTIKWNAHYGKAVQQRKAAQDLVEKAGKLA